MAVTVRLMHATHFLFGSIWNIDDNMGVSKNRGENPQNGWFIIENPVKMDDLGVPLFLETPIYCTYIIYAEG